MQEKAFSWEAAATTGHRTSVTAVAPVDDRDGKEKRPKCTRTDPWTNVVRIYWVNVIAASAGTKDLT